jgi:hypothetical protein
MLSIAVIAGLVATATPPTAGAASAPTYSVSPTSGPVGTEVHLSGNVGAASACPSLSGQHTGFLEFTHGSIRGGARVANEWINVTVAPGGGWSAVFVIPSFVGGQAMTVGSQGAAVTPGTWTFGIPSCGSGPAPQVDFQVTSASPPPSTFVGMAPTADGHGYWLAQAQGGVFAYGDAPFDGSLPGLHVTPAAPIVAVAADPSGGYWLVGADGGVYAFGGAPFYGSLPADHVTPFGPIVGITPTADGGGYWLVGAGGGVFAFGDAAYAGSANTGVPRVALLPTADGAGYILPSSTGLAPAVYGDASAVFTAGGGSPPMALDALVTGAAMDRGATGYWEVSADGGVYAFGSAAFDGSLPAAGVAPAAPITAMAAAPGGGYWLLGADGGVFAFGGAGFFGSAAGANTVLRPATVPPVSAECTQPLTHDADGNVQPLLCPSGGVNTAAWQVYASGSVGNGPVIWSRTLGLGPGATSTQVWQAMCTDYADMYGTKPLTESAETLAAAYYGWHFSTDPATEFTTRGCPAP